MNTMETIVGAIETATVDVFSTMIGVPVDVEDRTGMAVVTSERRVVSHLSLKGASEALAVMSCTSKLACKLSSVLLQSEFSSIDSDVLDATGEIANMVIGNVKNAIEVELGNLALSTPLTQDINGAVVPQESIPPVTVAFRSCDERFTISLIFANPDGSLPELPMALALPV
jgi:CheY-specific phosphatase CheX